MTGTIVPSDTLTRSACRISFSEKVSPQNSGPEILHWSRYRLHQGFPIDREIFHRIFRHFLLYNRSIGCQRFARSWITLT